MPICTICGEEVDGVVKCKECGERFCEDCGEPEKKLCYYCDEEEDEPEEDLLYDADD